MTYNEESLEELLKTTTPNMKVKTLNLHGIINSFNISKERKVQIINKREFMSSKDTNEKRGMYITSTNLENMIGEDTVKIITEILILFCIDSKML